MDAPPADPVLSDDADNRAGDAPWLSGAGEGASPLLELDGFSGPLELLLTLARGHQVDLARISLPALVDQLVAALRQTVPLGQKGDWVVTAARLVLLRSGLLLPVDAPALRAAESEADQLRRRLLRLQEVQALAGWLERRPQLGQEVFPRGQPELLGAWTETDHEVDVIEFLWASLALFDDANVGADTATLYRPAWLDLHSVPGARTRILRLLAETPEGRILAGLLPEAAGEPGGARSALRRRSAWASTFAASLELARQGEVVLEQEETFSPIHISAAAGAATDRTGRALWHGIGGVQRSEPG